ncbi:MAG: DUF2470 domain-containing protein [Pseudomonadota bacterium]
MDHLSDEEKRRIIEHMNDDHADACLLYVQHFGQLPHAIGAQMRTITSDAMTLAVRLEDSQSPSLDIDIPFDESLLDIQHATRVLVQMVTQAREKLA